MIKHIFKILGLMLLFIGVGTIGFYKLAGTYSGQDAICLSGLIAGICVGLWYGKANGVQAIYAVLACAVILSLPLVILSLSMAYANQDYAESLAFFSIGFALLSSYVVGLGWGKHLTRQSSKGPSGRDALPRAPV
ncbi:hypothetical protein P3339_08245 [Microbulbifer sp. MLAF003]|uniref:hypothetical protein n=1 Tax=unclassified Microbulbifer TaxID=2619833 RepID=UPI0024AD4FA8|nr:hypothetical protein [Microbulbifer sp. MLAF003]WHI52739.1 hypothetical protein P3339_08245 [Microbulbifer sp. MLAF003]